MSKTVLKCIKFKSPKTRFCSNFQLRSMHAAKHVWVAVITNSAFLHSPWLYSGGSSEWRRFGLSRKSGSLMSECPSLLQPHSPLPQDSSRGGGELH